ncbi:hypothetical protein M427DRAFT_426260 [Gonapodya prolifera JEL478]|uniref:Uncharacterized protein n=1 Tax=Gonapodya prolifera (strain JEL478) TaxID=1344416 RepID=A0A139A4D8_GONPJ|nr:hypothetical protein M427DRAFT_426260 [Gonapodya prolifera JEL478]|eukprot:KXS11661.1 hypothetical protein M427DRAFT_426260 [Gonapodya prolifera JEL478]
MSRTMLFVFYGPSAVTDQAILDKIATAIDTKQRFQVTPDNFGGDTAVGITKAAVVYYSLRVRNSPLRCRTAVDFEYLEFATDITTVAYGETLVTDPSVYENMIQAFRKGESFQVTNTSMAGSSQPESPTSVPGVLPWKKPVRRGVLSPGTPPCRRRQTLSP